MIIFFEKNIFNELFLKNKAEFEKLVSLLKINFMESIKCDNYNQNFIYLDNETCEFLRDAVIDNELKGYLDKYYDNLTFIKSSIKNFKNDRIEFVLEKKDSSCNIIEYQYEKVKNLISFKPKIIIENINDQDIYDMLINSCNEEVGLKLNYDFNFGNGSQISKILEKNKDKNEINIIITDKDKKYPEDCNKSSTPFIVSKTIKKFSLPHKHIVINFKNIEGLFPLELIRKKGTKSFKYFDLYYQKNNDWLEYFDFKVGIKKNIYSEKKYIITDSLNWWKEILQEEELDKIIETMPDNEIFKTGINNFSSELKLSDFKKYSSKEQKKEYQRIYLLIYPYIIANDYGI